MNHLTESELEHLLTLVDEENTAYWPLSQMLIEKQKENQAYMDNFITVGDYVDDMYQEEHITAVVEKDVSAGPWVYSGQQKIPNFDVTERTHGDFGFVGKLPGLKKLIKNIVKQRG